MLHKVNIEHWRFAFRPPKISLLRKPQQKSAYGRPYTIFATNTNRHIDDKRDLHWAVKCPSLHCSACSWVTT